RLRRDAERCGVLRAASKIAPRTARHVTIQLYLRRAKNQEQKTRVQVRGFSGKNAKSRMTKIKCRMKAKARKAKHDKKRRFSSFDFSSFFRHLIFDIRISRHEWHKPTAGENAGLRLSADFVHGV